jgi:hypothetical protein
VKGCSALVPNMHGDPEVGLEGPRRKLDLRIRRLPSPEEFTYIVTMDEAIARSHRTTDKAHRPIRLADPHCPCLRGLTLHGTNLPQILALDLSLGSTLSVML